MSIAKLSFSKGMPHPATMLSGRETSAPNISAICSILWAAVSSPQTPLRWKPISVSVDDLNCTSAAISLTN
ncbi:hypothetical protein VHN57_07390 [Sphingobium sp. WW5]|uniref:hypothetical protein n=1 Tax=unclassified Sphingobium TaxID=2611147 RepID=UPI003C19B579